MKKKICSSVMLLVSLGLLSSCEPVLKLCMGIKKPSGKTPEELLAYARKKSMPTDNIFYFRDSASFVNTVNALPTLTEIEVYDTKGNLITFKEPGACAVQTDQFLNNICLSAKQPPDTLKTIAQRMKDLVEVPGNLAARNYKAQDYDYTIILYWATYLGTLNKKNPRTWEQIIQNKNECRIRVFKVSLDIMDNWQTN